MSSRVNPTDAPKVLDIDLPNVRMRALAWGPASGRLAICVHGFPDSARSWRRLAPLLVAHGFRVVAPFTRGYWPTALARDDDYHLGALMSDVLELHQHLGGDDDAILIGHDWGAWTTNAIAARPGSPFAAHISMALPPVRAIDSSVGGVKQQLKMSAVQLRMSWYIMFLQLPLLPQRVLHRVIPRLWRDWSPPGADVSEGAGDALDSLPTIANRFAAVSYYRAMFRNTRPGAKYAELHRYRFSLPIVPILVLQGTLDGAMQVGYTRNLADALPAGTRVETIDGAGHFLQLDQPEVACELILSYLRHDATAPNAVDGDAS